MNNQGIALLITMLLLGTIIATSFGITVLTVNQTSSTRLIDDSISAIFAADSGIEKMMFSCSGDKVSPLPSPAKFISSDMGNGASYVVYMADNSGIETDDCSYNTIKSYGSKGTVHRAFQAGYP